MKKLSLKEKIQLATYIGDQIEYGPNYVPKFINKKELRDAIRKRKSV